MQLYSCSRVANETRTVFAWWPVRIRSVEVMPDKKLKVIHEKIVWLQRVGVRHILQSGIYQGKTYYELEKETN